MVMALTPGRRAVLTFGLPLSLGFIAYGTLSIVNAIGLTHYTQSALAVPQAQVLTVNAHGGSVRLRPSPDSNVHVSVKGLYALRTPTLRTISTKSGVTVTGSCPTVAVITCSQNITIELPVAFQVTAHSSGGDVSASGLTGQLDLTSSAGDVADDGAIGRLTMTSSAGDVDGTNLRSSDVTASSSAGDVSLQFAVDPTRVEAGSSAGDVDVRVPNQVAYRVTVQSSGGDAVNRVNQESTSTRTIDAHSSAGDVSVRPNE
jgi:Putative adhesin